MELTEIMDIIVKVIEKFGSKCSPEEQEKIKGILIQFFVEGKPPVEAMGRPKEDSELMYSYCVSLYDGGKYKEALPGFWNLFTLDPRNPRYIFGFAACLHKLKKYEDAIENYLVAARLEPDNPTAWGHMADCYINLGQLELAATMIAKAVEVAGVNPEHQKFKQQATLIHQALRAQIDGEDAKASPEPTVNVGS
ncbi:MAG: tetratricopeptide repeat protein [Parachlamydiaceae bacterium]|nr:tetratricopeptide repeat protein [Parachlamydiaceae bacterium]